MHRLWLSDCTQLKFLRTVNKNAIHLQRSLFLSTGHEMQSPKVDKPLFFVNLHQNSLKILEKKECGNKRQAMRSSETANERPRRGPRTVAPSVTRQAAFGRLPAFNNAFRMWRFLLKARTTWVVSQTEGEIESSATHQEPAPNGIFHRPDNKWANRWEKQLTRPPPANLYWNHPTTNKYLVKHSEIKFSICEGKYWCKNCHDEQLLNGPDETRQQSQ